MIFLYKNTYLYHICIIWGFMGVVKLRNAYEKDFLYFEDMGISDAFRRKGIVVRLYGNRRNRIIL